MAAKARLVKSFAKSILICRVLKKTELRLFYVKYSG
jgi:hypothetical protein